MQEVEKLKNKEKGFAVMSDFKMPLIIAVEFQHIIVYQMLHPKFFRSLQMLLVWNKWKLQTVFEKYVCL